MPLISFGDRLWAVMENLQTLGLALSMVLAAAAVGQLIHRKNSVLLAVALGIILMQLLNGVLKGMGFWYFGGASEPWPVELVWYGLHVPVIWFIASDQRGQQGRHQPVG